MEQMSAPSLCTERAERAVQTAACSSHKKLMRRSVVLTGTDVYLTANSIWGRANLNLKLNVYSFWAKHGQDKETI